MHASTCLQRFEMRWYVFLDGQVVIGDSNDNAPHFSESLYEATVPENSPWGTVVTRVVAHDLDSGKARDTVYTVFAVARERI